MSGSSADTSGANAAEAAQKSAQLNADRQRQMSRVLYWRFYVNLSLMLVDMAAFIIAGNTVLHLVGQAHSFTMFRFGFSLNLTVYLLLAAAIVVWCLHTSGVYHRRVMGDGYQLNMLLFKGMVRAGVALCALNFALDLDLWFSSLVFMVAAAWLAIVLERIVMRIFITRNRMKGAYAYGVVIVGSPKGIERTLRFINKRQQLNYRPMAVCPIRENPETGNVESDPNREDLERLIQERWGAPLPVLEYNDHDLAEQIVNIQAQTVMVADVMPRYSDNFNIFSVRMESLDLEVASIGSAADASGHEIQIRNIQGTTIITQRLAQYSLVTRFAKRVFDIVVSSLAILLSLIITVPVAIAIKLTDHGPVFYTQQRIGLRGRPFRMFKFRSMVVNADDLKAKLAAQTGQQDRFIFKMKNDPRITPVGHFIRRFSIDELPQFLNVFKGDMSVVGPRPPLPEEYERYNKMYATRMLVKPGITGPWQVSGRSDLSAEQSEALDVSYVQNWSVLGDIVIMLRTVGAVLSHKGAY